MNSSKCRDKIFAGLVIMMVLFSSFVVATPAHSAESAGGFLGRTLPEVERQDFFTGYHLAEFARKETPYNAGVVMFRPAQTPVPFDVAATTDKRKHVLAIQLWVRRSFVDDSAGGSGVRDIVLKFLREAPPPEDVRQLTELTNEIQHADVASRSAVGPGTPGMKPPAKPSAAYLAFTGRQKSYQQPLGESALQILNYRDRYGEVLILQLALIGHGKGEQAVLPRLRAALL